MSVAGLVSLNTATASDTELVRAVRAGEDEAFEELYRRYHVQIAAFAGRVVRDYGRAEDVTQEAFVSALRHMRQTQCEIQFKPWIYGIARNAAIDSLRRSGRTQEVPFEFHPGLGAADAAQLAGPLAPDAAVIARERFENFRGALDELSDSHHRIIVMRELEGLSYREIGARMHLSPGAVESTLFRARRKLEHEYAQLDTGRRCQSMGAVIARLAEGVESKRDRVRLDRHARRCTRCRTHARRLGVEPMRARSVRRRAAALLPLPGFLRRPQGLSPVSAPRASYAQEVAGAMAAPGFETAVQAVGKAAAVVASALAIGGMGATLGGVGPLAVDGGGTPVKKGPVKRDPTTGVGRDAPLPRSGPPGLRLPRPAGEDGRKPSRRPRDGRAAGATPAPSAPAPSGLSSPILPGVQGVPGVPGVPKLPPAAGGELSLPAPHVRPRGPSDLPSPSLPSVPQAQRTPDLPALPSPDAARPLRDAVPDPVGSVKPLSDEQPPF